MRVNPLALPLRAYHGDVVPRDLFLGSRFFRFEISLRRVTRSSYRFRGRLPILVFLYANLHFFECVGIVTLVLFTMFFDPDRYLNVLFLVVSSFNRAAGGLYRVGQFVARTRVFLRGIQICGQANGAREGATRERVEFTARYNCDLDHAYGARGFFDCVYQGEVIVRILCVTAVGTGYQGSFLYVSYRRDDRVCDSQALYSVRSPGDFQVVQVRVRYFNAMAPT